MSPPMGREKTPLESKSFAVILKLAERLYAHYSNGKVLNIAVILGFLHAEINLS